MSELYNILSKAFSRMDDIEGHYTKLLERIEMIEQSKTCDRCGEKYSVTPVTLGTIYHCVLCNECWNLWDMRIKDNCLERATALALLNGAVSVNGVEEIERLAGLVVDIDTELFGIAEQFVLGIEI